MLLLRYGLIREQSLLGHLIMRIPRRWFHVMKARVGYDTTTYIVVHLKNR